MEQSIPVRVVRGHKCPASYSKKVYTYDGLYKVGRSNANIYLSVFALFNYFLTAVNFCIFLVSVNELLCEPRR